MLAAFNPPYWKIRIKTRRIEKRRVTITLDLRVKLIRHHQTNVTHTQHRVALQRVSNLVWETALSLHRSTTMQEHRRLFKPLCSVSHLWRFGLICTKQSEALSFGQQGKARTYPLFQNQWGPRHSFRTKFDRVPLAGNTRLVPEEKQWKTGGPQKNGLMAFSSRPLSPRLLFLASLLSIPFPPV